jgi:uncharacterized membrane protein
MLSALKIILLVIGIPTLLLGFIVGVPFLVISLPCLFGAVAIDRYQAKIRNNGSQTSSSSNIIWSFVVIVFGIGLYFGLTSIGSLGNIDTTGKASSGTQIGSLIFCAVLVIAGLAFVNRNRK